MNASVKVLMYWNSKIHFDFYECEAQVQPTWYYPDTKHRKFYNYSVPEFRRWWVQCAIESVQNSSGVLDGECS